MRRLALTLALVLSACAARQQPVQPQQPPPVAQPAQPQTRRLIGLTAQDLVGHFGNPQLQLREGNSLKLQFRGERCVLDAYLYPSQSGLLKVTHIDTRAPSGADTDQAACISALERSS
jgi:hypothetical protein